MAIEAVSLLLEVQVLHNRDLLHIWHQTNTLFFLLRFLIEHTMATTGIAALI